MTLRIFPVIHALDFDQCLSNAKIAHEAGTAGVFLIQMDGQDELLDTIGQGIRQALPGLKIGVNYLSMAAFPALERGMGQGWDASWSDNPGVRSEGISDEAKRISELLAHHPNHLYFGSVAFKYQRKDPDPGQAACRAQTLGMIPTTSGEATGYAPTHDKLALIRQTMGSGALAVASGITAENLPQLGPYLTHILVATGIGQDFYHICPEKLGRLVGAAAQLKSPR